MLFADDVLLMAENKEQLQALLNEAETFSKDIQTNFGIEKCKVMIINKRQNENIESEYTLMGRKLEEVEEFKYLGLKINKNGLEGERNKMRSKAEKMYGIINGKTNCRVNKYEVIRGLWKGIAVPTIMYGTELIGIGKKEMKGLEIVQNKAARKGLGANRHVGIEALRGDMGWSTFEERINMTKIKYRVRLEQMESSKWAKKVFIWRNRNSKFVKETNNSMKQIEMKIVETQGEKEILLEGNKIEGNEKKIGNIIKKEIQKKGVKKWKENMEKKNSLRWYKVKEKPRKENIYDGSWGSTLLFKARTDSLELNEKKRKWGGVNDKCEKCEDGSDRRVETLEHFVTECKAYEEERRVFENKIRHKIGEEIWERRKVQDDKGMKLLLGLEDNKEIVGDTKQYLREIWKKRGRKEKIRDGVSTVEHNYTRNI